MRGPDAVLFRTPVQSGVVLGGFLLDQVRGQEESADVTTKKADGKIKLWQRFGRKGLRG